MTDIEMPDVIGATRRAETIRQGMISYAAAMDAIGEAYEARDWVTLKYPDWDTYCEKEFSEKRLKLTRAQREQAVLAFRGAGMSIRAIGSALGVSPGTVHGDLAGVQDRTPDTVTGADGKTYAATRPAGEIPQLDDTQASGLGGTSPSAESGEDRPATAELGEAEGRVPSAADVTTPSASTTGEDSAPVESPVDEPEQPAAGVSPAAPDSDEDDDEKRLLDWRRGVSRDLMQALVDVHMRLQPSPAAWLERFYLPDSYPDRNMPRVRDCFTPENIRISAQYLLEVAEWLEKNGVEL